MTTADLAMITKIQQQDAIRKLTPAMAQADPEIRLSPNACCITHEADPQDPCAIMPCNHSITPSGLTGLMSSLVTSRKHSIICPASRDPSGDATLQAMMQNLDMQSTGAFCGTEWPYTLCKKIAVLTCEEKQWFEQRLSCNYNAAIGVRECPSCGIRMDMDTRNAMKEVCITCFACKQPFCWKCSQSWKLINSQMLCGNSGCHSKDLTSVIQYLSDCPTKLISTMNVPESRACPKCASQSVVTLIQHSQGCKHTLEPCPTCQHFFCFACLSVKTAYGWSCGNAHTACPNGVAPRQQRQQLQPPKST